MHYITGTYFTVNSQIRTRTSQDGESLLVGTTYQILKIERRSDQYIYTFIDSNKTKVTISFKSCREADKMISTYRRERIPDYESYYASSTDV